MEEMIAKLSVSFKKYEVPDDKKEEFGDEMTLGNSWMYDEPHQVEYWSIILIPTTNKLGFYTKWNNSSTSLPLSLFEEVVDISEGANGFIFVTSETNDLDQEKPYRFSYMVEPL